MDMQVKLTQFSHGGGCGCKIAPGVLEQILSKAKPGIIPRDLLVGIETSDDAAVYRLNDRQAIVATTDFFMPIVDDPFDFGAIAATNAISDIYAMGGQPLFALALVGMPVNQIPLEVIRLILEGGESVCARAGIPIAGGHTIDSVEPIYGLVAIGLVDPKHVKRNSGAQPGDQLVLGKPLGVGIYSAALKKGKLDDAGIPIAGGHTIDSVEPIYGLVAIGLVDPKHVKRNSGAQPGDQLVLGKPLGVGIYSAALKKGKLDDAGYRAMIESTTRLNTPGTKLGTLEGVHALTDVTGFGLLGHLVEIARGSGTAAHVRWDSVPLLPGVLALAREGILTGASGRNWSGYGDRVRLAPGLGDAEKAVLTDPQTSGGLLAACSPESVEEVLAIFRAEGFDDARIIGNIRAGDAIVEVS